MKLKRTVGATFTSKHQARMTLSKLDELGVEGKDIGVLVSHRGGEDRLEMSAKVANSLALGSAIGGAVGALFGGLTTAAGTLTLVDGVFFFAPGFFFSTLAGIGLGSTIGGLSGWYATMSADRYEPDIIEGQLIKDGILIVVTVNESKAHEIRGIYEQEGGKHISIARNLDKIT